MRNLQELIDTGKRRLKQRQTWVNVLLLAPIFTGVYLFAWMLRFEGQLDNLPWRQATVSLGFIVALKLAVFAGFFGGNNWSRYLTFHDLGTLAQAATISSMIMLFGDFLIVPDRDIPRSVFLMDWCGTIVGIGAVRAMVRWVRERGKEIMSGGGQPVLIVGANDTGEALLREIRRNTSLPYRVDGFIASDSTSVGSKIGGVRVLGTTEDTCKIAKRHGLDQVLITAGDLPGKQVRQLVSDGKRDGVNVSVLPSFEQLLNGRVGLRPREVSIEDLLRRDPVQLEQEKLHTWLKGRTILVTGGAGSIGSEICRQLLQFGPAKLVVVDRNECNQFFLERELQADFPDVELAICMADGCDPRRMEQVFEDHKPSVVFHAAAYKHVPLMEVNRGQAVKNIVSLTKNLADLADSHNVESFVMISTDKAVNPTSVMGACKRVAELYVQSLAESSSCRFVTVRFGNVLDSAGSVIPIFRQQIARGGPITVTDANMVRYFMMIPEASQLVIQAGCMGAGGEIFVLDMGEPVRIMDLARDMIQLSGLTVGDDIEIEISGIRPGEKLYEELHIDGERHVETSHPKIMVAESTKMNRFEIVRGIKRLENLVHMPGNLIMDELHQLIPQLRHAEVLGKSVEEVTDDAPTILPFRRAA